MYYVKEVETNGNKYKFVYVDIDGIAVCLGYLDRYNNLVVYSRNK